MPTKVAALPVGEPIPEAEGTLDYSFAVEYHGPPIHYDIPQAIPIEIERIPLAAPVAVSDPLSLPVVQPLPSTDPVKRPPIRQDLKNPDTIVSPTSVIGFEHAVVDGFEVSGEIGSSCCGVSGPCDGVEESGDLSEAVVEFSSEFKESLDFSYDRNTLQERISTESALSSEFGFRSSASINGPETPEGDLKRQAVVTFEEKCVSEEGTSPGVGGAQREGAELPERKPKKGACYRCFKGNRFTEKEVCIVCNAKYCGSCVLRAMGSMPEGRKCLTCIGNPIDESKREGLGKCSRMLKKLLSPLEIEQVMKAEKLCEANQLRSEHVSVNGRSLFPEEMILLQMCANPPAKLKPGHYWYDKVSGLWGKEGHKPHSIISPHMNIGGCLMPNASNGNAGVYINGREITKSELRMLQLAGVQCAGSPHFWVNADGTYQEEGMKNIKGNLWGKAGMKLVCSFLSLPHPSKMSTPYEEEVDMITRSAPEYLEQRSLQKFLLVGCPGSGASTIFMQAKLLYKPNPFSEEERENIKVMIQSSIYQYLCVLLEGREHFEEEWLAEKRKECPDEHLVTGNESNGGDENNIYFLPPRLKTFSDWLLKVMASGNLDAIFPAATREYSPIVEELWKDPAIQATYQRRSELQSLPTATSYFLERVVDISRLEYEPSNMDILYANGNTSTNGLAYTEFFFPHSAYDCSGIDDAGQHETVFRYQLIRVHMRGLGENRKWLEMFEDARMVIFCVGLSDYNEHTEDPSGAVINKMLASKRLFESIATHPTFEQMEFLLILNKFDLLEKQIDQAPLTQCDWFHDYNPLTSQNRPSKNRTSNSRSANHHSSTPAQQASYYIAIKFKRLFASLTGRRLYVTTANALESDSVDDALRYAREILKWEEERIVFGTGGEFSAYSTDPSSLSD